MSGLIKSLVIFITFCTNALSATTDFCRKKAIEYDKTKLNN